MLAGRFAAGFHEFSAVSCLLFATPGEEAGKVDRANAQRWLLWVVCAGCAALDPTPLEVFHRFSGLSGLRRLCFFALELCLFSRRRPVLVVHRCLAAQ